MLFVGASARWGQTERGVGSAWKAAAGTRERESARVREKEKERARERASERANRERERARERERGMNKQAAGRKSESVWSSPHISPSRPLLLSPYTPLPQAVPLLAHSAHALSLPSLFLPRTHPLATAGTLRPHHFSPFTLTTCLRTLTTCLRTLASRPLACTHIFHIFTRAHTREHTHKHKHTHTHHTPLYGPSCRSTCP